MCHAIHRYMKANNKNMKDYGQRKELSYLIYWELNNLYGQAMQQKLSALGFEWRKYLFRFNKELMHGYVKNSDKWHILEAYIKCSKELLKVHCDMPFLPRRMKIDKCVKLERSAICMTRKLCHILSSKF